MKESFVLLKSEKYISDEIEPTSQGEASATDRQERVPGFDQAKLTNLRITMIGAGGLGSEIGEGFIRKGLGSLKILDGDEVALSNLSRQRFYKEDLYKNKALCLAKNLRKEAVKKSVIAGHPFTVQEAVEQGVDCSCDIAICGPDNNPARVFVSRYFYEKQIPVVFTAVSRDANHGYVFVQETGQVCFGCLFPEALNDKTEPCPNTPAVKDILKVVAGIVLYAVDSLVMERRRNWNYRQIFLGGFVPDILKKLERKENCVICCHVPD